MSPDRIALPAPPINPTRIFIALLLLAAVVVSGVAGYVTIEHYTLLDAVYMTVITIATIGFREVNPLTNEGKIFTIFLVVFGIATATYCVGTIITFIAEGHLNTMVRKRRLIKKMGKYHDHYIVCGGGQLGEHVIDELWQAKVPMVVIDRSPAAAERIRLKYGDRILIEVADATKKESLLRAGIERAKGVICTLSHDADNVYLILTAKDLRPDIYIVATCYDPEAEAKIYKSGADKVIMPKVIAGIRLASYILRPAVCSFVDVVTHTDDVSLRLEEIRIPADSHLAGKTLRDSRITQHTHTIVVAIKRQDGQFIANPLSPTVLQAEDALIILGDEENVGKMRRYVQSPEL